MSKYKAIIGLEMHCEISTTNTKAFSGAANNYSGKPNSNIRPVDMAFPGTLPVINKEAVRKALMASLILKCKQPEYLYFERKNYYYPDLPKGFQITQETKPCPVGIYGQIKYLCNGEEKEALVNNIHLEEDAASLDHYSNFSTINYNRAGVPLLELVTEPCFHNAEEAVSFVETMCLIYRYTNISEADTKKGHIRCDVNVSIMNEELDETDPKNYGTKIEVKNVNSLGGVRDAINYEIERQTKLKDNGEYKEMEQQTRRWDEDEGKTFYMRSKVDAIDYKYFIEPNIPKYKITSEFLDKIKEEIPVLPSERRTKYITDLNLSEYDATVLIKEKEISDYFDELIKYNVTPKDASNWITTTLLGYLNKDNLTFKDLTLTPQALSELINLVTNNKISLLNAKKVLAKSIELNKEPLKIVEEENLTQIEDDTLLLKLVNEAIDENPNVITEYKNGKDNSANFLVGQVMKKTKGQANPGLTLTLIKQELEKR